MANNCDDIFQQIQALEAQKAELSKAKYVLASVDPGEGTGKKKSRKRKPEVPPGMKAEPTKGNRRFSFDDAASGGRLEVDLADLDKIIRQLDDETFTDLVAGRIDAISRPMGSEGQFTNFKQLIERMGIDGAQDAGELIEALTGRWREMDPDDYKRVVAINDKQRLAERVSESYAKVGIELEEDAVLRGIVEDAAPFMTILDKQAKLQVVDGVLRDALVDEMKALRDEIEAKGLKPSPESVEKFRNKALQAVIAQKAAVQARRVSGQLLQQLQGDFSLAPGVALDEMQKRLKESMGEVTPDGARITEGTLEAEVLQAISSGPDGLETLQKLIDTVKREGLDPASSLNKDWKNNWRRDARAAYKDSVLFNANTQMVSNYLSNKTVYWMEGYRAAWSNTWGYAMTGTPFLNKQLGETALWKGIRTVAMAKSLTDDVVRQAAADALGESVGDGKWARIKQSYGQLWNESFLGGKMPFGDSRIEVDIDDKGRAAQIEADYQLANRVLYGEDGIRPETLGGRLGKFATSGLKEMGGSAKNVYTAPFLIRDKIFWGFKVVNNALIESGVKRLTGKDIQLPLNMALQGLATADNRAGLRVYSSVRANDLIMETFKEEPSLKKLSWKQRKEQVAAQLEEEFYSATPTDAEVKGYRKQFGVPDYVQDQAIREQIAKEMVGKPVIDRAERADAFKFSRYARMQTPPSSPALNKIDSLVQEWREDPYIDAVLPFWRSGFSSALYVMGKNVLPPLDGTAKLMFGTTKPTTKQKAQVAANWSVFLTWWGAYMGMRTALKEDTSVIVQGDGPNQLDPEKRQQWKLANEGRTFLGIPGLSQVPIVSVFMVMDDIASAVEQSTVSQFDQWSALTSAFQVFSGQLMRSSGFGQFRYFHDAMMSNNPQAFRRTMGYIANAQLNPNSGVMRQAERGLPFVPGMQGVGMDERYRPRPTRPADKAIERELSSIEEAPGFNILENLRDQVGQWLKDASTGGPAGLTRLPIKEVDYLGRDLRTPEGWFKREWPVGWPGQYDNMVHNTLLGVGMLKPPAPLMTGRLDGAALGPDGEKEFNQYLAFASSPGIANDPAMRNRLTWRKQAYFGDDPVSGKAITKSAPLNLAEFLTNLTAGRTQYEALADLFASDTWKEWQQDPRFTLTPSESYDPAAADAPREELMKRPGAWAISTISDHYSGMARVKMLGSTTPAAEEWNQRRKAGLEIKGGPNEAIDQTLDLDQTIKNPSPLDGKGVEELKQLLSR